MKKRNPVVEELLDVFKEQLIASTTDAIEQAVKDLRTSLIPLSFPEQQKEHALAMMCEHANEVPRECSCPHSCYCRIEGACYVRFYPKVK